MVDVKVVTVEAVMVGVETAKIIIVFVADIIIVK